MNVLYPKLNTASANTLAEEHNDRSLTELADFSSPDFDNATYTPTGGRKASTEELKSIRLEIVNCVKSLGYPGESSQASRKKFDVNCAKVLHGCMKINIGEGGQDDVWSFMSCVLLPDIVAWRWPERHKDRFIGGVRNTFQRLWWRARVLFDGSAQDGFHLLKLPEDTLVQIMERPNMMADWRLSQRIAFRSEALEKDKDIRKGHKESIHRNAIKRIRQKRALMNLQAIPLEELDSIIDAQFLSSIDCISD